MKKYLICEDVNNEDVVYIETEEETQKGDLVVAMDCDEPILTKVIDFMDELKAITSERNFLNSLAVVSVKKYYEARQRDIEKARLVKLMKEQMDLQKMEDTLAKNSECNPEMASLYSKYNELCGNAK